MKNFSKGWITSAIGLVGMVCITLHATGLYTFPQTGYLNKPVECIIAFVISLALFLFPASKIEEIITGIIKRKSDKV